MHTFCFLRTKPRLSQAGALLLPKDFVSLNEAGTGRSGNCVDVLQLYAGAFDAEFDYLVNMFKMRTGGNFGNHASESLMPAEGLFLEHRMKQALLGRSRGMAIRR